ncbi:winged helix-turn-helix domain-containing protein [Amycolatopsis acidicola]
MADHLMERIANGELPPQMPLPAEGEISRQYGVSLGTTRLATQLLRQRGLVMTLRSKGTYPVKNSKKIALWFLQRKRDDPEQELADFLSFIEQRSKGTDAEAN